MSVNPRINMITINSIKKPACPFFYVDWIDIDGLSFSNGYEERIWVKPEDNSKSPLWVYPGEYYPYGIDGYQPPFWDGDWLKVPTGISCSVDDKGQNDRWRDENLNWKDYLKSWTPDIDFIDRFPGRKNKDYYKKYPGWKNP